MAIKQKTIDSRVFDDAIISTVCRVDLVRGSIGTTITRTSRRYDNMRTRRSYNNNHEKRIEYKHRYRDADKMVERLHNGRYKFSCPTLGFLGEAFPMRTLSRAPAGYVWHHTCYDHADPEANVVLLSRSSHVMGHVLLRKLGIEIEHINRRC